MPLKNSICSILFACLCLPLAGQDIDSLRAVVDTAQGPAKVKTLNELFKAHLRSDPVEAIGYASQALAVANDVDDKRGMAAAYNNLGVAYRNQGALDKALEYYITSLQLYTSLDNQEGIATTKNNIATIYMIKKDYAQAMRYLEESYNLLAMMKDEVRLVGSMNNLGNLYSDIQLFEKAQEYYSKAYQLAARQGTTYADPLINMGNIQFKQGNYQRAVGYYEQALEIEKQNNNRIGILNIVTNLGITFTKAKQPRRATPYLEEALKIADELQAQTMLPTIYKAAAENYSNQGKWKEAYETQLKYDAAREQVHSEESSRNIAQMEMLIEFQEKERELEMLRKEDEIKTLELRNSRLFIIVVVVTILGVLGYLNLFFLSRRKKLINP